MDRVEAFGLLAADQGLPQAENLEALVEQVLEDRAGLSLLDRVGLDDAKRSLGRHGALSPLSRPGALCLPSPGAAIAVPPDFAMVPGIILVASTSRRATGDRSAGAANTELKYRRGLETWHRFQAAGHPDVVSNRVTLMVVRGWGRPFRRFWFVTLVATSWSCGYAEGPVFDPTPSATPDAGSAGTGDAGGGQAGDGNEPSAGEARRRRRRRHTERRRVRWRGRRTRDARRPALRGR